jgi:hypothetical protein
VKIAKKGMRKEGKKKTKKLRERGKGEEEMKRNSVMQVPILRVCQRGRHVCSSQAPAFSK